ncbi:MAG: hypothetical protein ACPGXX_14325, partial [Planctomycetaceae bacterium]
MLQIIKLTLITAVLSVASAPAFAFAEGGRKSTNIPRYDAAVNKALEFLNGGSVDFGSTAGAASVIGRANGIPIKAVYV